MALLGLAHIGRYVGNVDIIHDWLVWLPVERSSRNTTCVLNRDLYWIRIRETGRL